MVTIQSAQKTINKYINNSKYLLQERFVYSLNTTREDKSLYWWIPLTWTTQSQAPNGFKKTKPMQWLKNSSKPMKINIGTNEDDWVIFNNQETGKLQELKHKKLQM